MKARKVWMALKMGSAAGVFGLALYSLISRNYSLTPLMTLCLGLMMIATGFEARVNMRKAYFPIFVTVGLFSLLVGVYTWIV